MAKIEPIFDESKVFAIAQEIEKRQKIEDLAREIFIKTIDHDNVVWSVSAFQALKAAAVFYKVAEQE